MTRMSCNKGKRVEMLTLPIHLDTMRASLASFPLRSLWQYGTVQDSMGRVLVRFSNHTQFLPFFVKTLRCHNRTATIRRSDITVISWLVVTTVALDKTAMFKQLICCCRSYVPLYTQWLFFGGFFSTRSYLHDTQHWSSDDMQTELSMSSNGAVFQVVWQRMEAHSTDGGLNSTAQ